MKDDPQRFHEIDVLLRQALDRPTSERSTFLEAATDDSELRAAVERLLEADEEAGTFIERPLFAAGSAVGSQLGLYRLLERIGRGGMGEVYLGERADGVFERRVAIKVLRGDLLGGEPLERMRLERRTLARLEHPSIARLYDAGTTPDGRPYLVLEHVEGLPIDRYCQEHQLPLEARLRLFRQVCEAVAFSHRHLLVHRDLKPANILVTAEGVPKLLDFGIAKLMHADGSAELTRTGVRPMTPSFASPEQMRGEPVTTATDVYALGVLLCLLLTGRLPYRVEATSPAQLESAICDDPPEPPSDLAAASTSDSATPPFSPRALRGDLDNIVLTALRKEPERRYASAEQLAEDVERFLEDRPVRARKDSWRYVLGKLVKRQRVAVATAALLLVAILASLVIVTLQMRRANRERQKAEVALGFLSNLFEQSDPLKRDGEPPTVRDVLDAGAARIEVELAAQPEIRSQLMATIAEAYTDQGLPEEALRVLERAIEGHRSSFGAGHLGEAPLLEGRGWAHYASGDLDQALSSFEESLAVSRQQLGETDPTLWRALSGVGATQLQKGEYDLGQAHLEQALALFERQRAQDPLELAEILGRLAHVHIRLARYDQAADLYRRCVELRRGVLGSEHFSVALDQVSLATALIEIDPDGAEEMFRRGIATFEAVLDGEPNPSLVTALSNFGDLLHRRGLENEGHRLYERSLAMSRELYSDDHLLLAGALSKLGIALSDQRRFAESAELYHEALSVYLEKLGEGHYHHARMLYLLALDQKELGNLEAAETGHRRSLEIFRQSLGPDHPHVGYPLHALGRLQLERGELAAALETFEQLGELLRVSLPADHVRVLLADASRGETLLSLGRLEEAGELLERSASQLAASLPPDDRRVVKLKEVVEALAAARAEAGGANLTESR